MAPCLVTFSRANRLVALSDLQGPLEALSQQQQQQQQAARLGQWGEAAGPFLQGGLAFPLPQQLPQQLAHLTQPGIARFPPQLLRPASWGLGTGVEEEGGVGCAPPAGQPYGRYAPCVVLRQFYALVPLDSQQGGGDVETS